jgi:integrase
MGLGSADAVSLKEARAKRDELIKLVDQGMNPLAERRRREHEQAAKRTFAECVEAYISQHRRGWSESSLWSWTYATQRLAKPLAKLKVDEIVVEDVKRAVAPIWDKGHLDTAKLALKKIEAVLNYARAHGWAKGDNPAAWGVFKYIMPKKPKGEPNRHPSLDWRELPPVMAELRQSEALTAPPLEFTALTATRISEASGMKWAEVDLGARVWTVPGARTKTRLPHRVPLSDRAMAILEMMAALRVGEYVFLGWRKSRAPSRVGIWKLCKQVTGGNASPHGFRSSFRSWCADNGVPRDAAEAALAHVVKGVEGSYQRSDLLERRRRIMQAWADYLSGEAASNVVELPARRLE